MKFFFVVQFVCIVSISNANDYYFSSVSGNDSRTSSQAQDPSTPWKTLSKLNSIFPSLQPGDAVLLKRGETFYGSIVIKKSGTSSSPIVIGAYGSGNNPVVTSLVSLTGWVSKGSGVWESGASSLGSSVNMVLLNGVNQQIGRWPNSDASNKGYLTYESHSGTSSISDKQFGSSSNWAGAELVLRPRRWILDRNKIKSNSSTSISYSASTSYDPYNNYGYFIQNSLKTLDKTGEWYYNPSTKKLSMHFGSGSPSSYSVQSPNIDKLISSSNYSNIEVNDITFKGAHLTGGDFNGGSNITLSDCEIQFSGEDGIIVNGTSRFIIQNSKVSNSNNNGIDLGYNSDNALVKNNVISNTSVFAGMGQSGDGTGIAIRAGGDNWTIEGNEILNTGYIPIFFNGSNVTIKNNLIDRFCFNKDDGAGIYSHKGSSTYSNRKAINNIVMNGLGAGPGTDRPDYYPASGFYMDNNASATQILNNTVISCSHYGVYIHNSFGSTISNNTFYDNNFTQVSFIQDADNVTIRNTTVTNNIFFSKKTTQLLTYFRSHLNDIGSFGTWNGNVYARPLDDRIAIYCQYSGGKGKQNLDMEGWKSSYNEDASSKRSAKQVMPYKIIKLINANKASSSSFSSSSSSSVNVGSVTKGKNYVLSFGLRGSSNNNKYLGAYLSNNSGVVQNRKLSTTRTQYEMLFTSATSESSARVSFKVDASSTYYLDNVKFYEADARITNPDDSIKIVYNATTATKSFAINGNYMDVKGNRYANNVSLQPFTSVVLMRTGGGSTGNLSPVIDITSPGDNVSFSALSDITINASANDDDGSVSKVEFYNDNKLLGSDNTSPYSYAWNNVPAGNYLLTAKATDNDGSSTTSSPVSIIVENSNQNAPTVNITSPSNGSNFTTLSDIQINASAKDNDGSVSKVDFYNGGNLLGSDNSSPYSITWNNVPAGNYTITAKATDNSGLSTTSSGVAVSVGTSTGGAPSVNITSPGNNSNFASLSDITISAVAADNDGSVYKVEFLNGSTLLKTEYLAPFTFVWNNVPAGNYTLTARAIDDDGLATTSAPVNITVGTSSGGSPTVSITSPVSNAKFATLSDITINASAADNNGSVYKVEFFNGATLIKAEYLAPFTFVWQNVPAGNYTLSAKATDNDGNATTSSPVNITVGASSGNPTVTLISPTQGANFSSPGSINLEATAAGGNSSVHKVEFFRGSTLIKAEYTAPYAFTWTNVPSGNYTISAKATDENGNVATSPGVSISVGNQQAARGASNVYNQSMSLSNDKFAPPPSPGGTLQLSKTAGIRLFPNPVVKTIQVYLDGPTLNEKSVITIQNASGAIVKKYTMTLSGNKKIDIDVSSLQPGIYLMGVSNEKFVINKKFVKGN